jgi:hypothetical protein
MAKVYIVSFRTHDDRRPSKFIILADNMRCAITMVWEDGGSDFQSRFGKFTAMRFLFSGRHMRINNIGGYTPVPLKFKLAVFLFCFNPSHSNKGFALCRSIERQ